MFDATTAPRRAGPATEGSAGMVALVLGLGLALLGGLAAAGGAWQVAITMAVAIPLVTLVLRYPWAAVLVWIVVMPFIVVDADGSAGAISWLVHRLMLPGILLVLLAYRALGLSHSRFRVSLTDAAIVIFVILALANIQLLSANPTRMSVAFYDGLFIPICMYWVVRLYEPREADVRRLIAVVAAVVAFEVAIGILSWVAPGVVPGQWLGRAGERTVGTLGGPGPYTVTLVLGALLFLLRGEAMRDWLGRWGMGLLAAAAFLGVFLSFSRGSWLGAAIVFVGLLIVYRRFALGLLTTALVLGLVLALGPARDQFTFANERLTDNSTAASRLVTNDAALRMIATEPWLGFGYGNFERFDEQFKERIGDIPAQEGSAHHAYLALAAENGVPALLLYLFPAAWIGWLTIRSWRLLPTEGIVGRRLVIVLWLALADQFAVANFMDMLHSSAFGTTLWWLSLGLIHAVVTRAEADAMRLPSTPALLTPRSATT